MTKLIYFLIGIAILFAFVTYHEPTDDRSERKLLATGLNTDTSLISIDFNKILSGGPGKDGIPAINNPKFVSIDKARENDNGLGIFVSVDGKERFYPYSILVWHEIVNDNIGENYFSVTFCPLCGTGIVYDRLVNGEVLEFGVSGLLFESNLLMYDKDTESLWSQSLGEAVVGEFLGTKLKVLPLQLIAFKELKEKYPQAKVLSRDTGHIRSYGLSPYGDYEENEDIYFPVSVQDEKFHPKTLMYVLPFRNKYIAFEYMKIKEGESTYTADGNRFRVLRDGGEINISLNEQSLPGYFELWFSYATQHKENGLVADLEK